MATFSCHLAIKGEGEDLVYGALCLPVDERLDFLVAPLGPSGKTFDVYSQLRWLILTIGPTIVRDHQQPATLVWKHRAAEHMSEELFAHGYIRASLLALENEFNRTNGTVFATYLSATNEFTLTPKF